MAAPKSDPPQCDVPGCGTLATMASDGTEQDTHVVGRVAIPNLNVCDHHRGWIFSEDARAFTINNPKYTARAGKK